METVLTILQKSCPKTGIKNNRGFAVALIMALLPLLVGAVLVTFAVVSFIQTDLKLRHVCRSEGIKGQEDVAPILKTLLALNPMALRLRLELVQARAHAASGHPVALARLAKVEMKISSLVTRQQQLLRQSNLLLLRSHASAQGKLWKEKNTVDNAVALFKGDLQVLHSTPPTLAVRPDAPLHPPTYSPAENFANKQALEQKWQYRLSIIKPLRAFLTGNYLFEKSCAVTLKEENSKWVPQMIRDRS